MRTTKVIAAAAFALLVAAACTVDYPYRPYRNPYRGSRTYDIRGTIDSIDPGTRSILLSNTRGDRDTVRVYYDPNTEVIYNGRDYRPQDLEPGDEVIVHASDYRGEVVAEAMDVTYNGHGTMSSSGRTYGDERNNVSTIRGTVRSVDESSRNLTIRDDNGERVTVQYDSGTRVDFNGRSFPVTNLERGDVVEVQVAGGGSSPFAERIVLVRDVNR